MISWARTCILTHVLGFLSTEFECFLHVEREGRWTGSKRKHPDEEPMHIPQPSMHDQGFQSRNHGVYDRNSLPPGRFCRILICPLILSKYMYIYIILGVYIYIYIFLFFQMGEVRDLLSFGHAKLFLFSKLLLDFEKVKYV